ncbi:MAG: Hsp70 family protein [Pirellulales bacterium]|nr:Hsp70 family protein [Pirellulales bacterium]
MTAKFVLGIDLGTTNSVLAYTPLDEDSPAAPRLFSVPQLVSASTVESATSLASFLYLATESETAAGAFDLPWARGCREAIGEVARRQAAENPTRTVAAAKSWLAHAAVDRRAAILPPGAPPEVTKISPLEASTAYLAHLVAAWNQAHPDAPAADQQVVLTVPASFDASARELTREAALAAGLPQGLVLLEEPQAAVYAWLAARGDAWRRQLQPGDTLLVCDVGGGTTDFTLIGAKDVGGELQLERLAVGNHILVGGDNMDLTLAHRLATAFGERGVQLDPWQSVALWHACRTAKESLLAPGGPEQHPVSILGRGSRLIGGTISVDLRREDALATLLDGFFPSCAASAKPARRGASGFRELGLPYEADVAVTRHLAAFLGAQGSPERPLQPTHVLFNGGVFRAEVFRQRLLDVLGGWFGGQQPDVLEGNDDFDHAVALGAAYYGLAKQGRGVRIRGGAPRSYYLGMESAGLAIPGVARPLRALCVVPFGMEEGTEVDVPSDDIGLVVGEPAHFRFFASATRKHDRPGDVLARWTEDELQETAPLETSLAATPAAPQGYVPVRFQARLTELGVLELWCVSTTSSDRWKLEFSVREDGGAG